MGQIPRASIRDRCFFSSLHQDPYKNYRWELKSWSINAEIDPFVSTSISVTNLFPVTQNFQIITTLPIAPPITPSSLMGGSLQGGISANNDGGTLSVPNASAYYFGQIDFTNVGPPAVLHPDGSPGADVTVGPFLSSSFPSVAFGQPIPSAPGPQALASIGIQLHFDLTPGDTATLSGVFVVEPVPEPGTGLLLGAALGGLALLRRRRVRD